MNLYKWKNLMDLYCSAEVFDPDKLKPILDSDPQYYSTFREKFEYVLEHRPITYQEWEDEMNVSFDTNEAFYDHLSTIYDFIYNNAYHKPYRSFIERR